MSTKFEQLLDLLVNEEMDKANELFHEIVVEKSREIYENMIAEEAEEDEEMDESADEEAEDDEELDEETTLEIGGDPADDMVGDVADDSMDGDTGGEFGGDEMDGELGDEGEGSEEERISDLEDALEELKAEFEALMADEKNEPEHNDGEDDPDFGGADDEESDDEEDEMKEEGEEEDEMAERMITREYVEKVGNDWEKNSMKTPGPVGSGKGDQAGQTSVSDTKSPVSSGKGKPATGATAHNILGDTKTGEGVNTGTSPNGKAGGLVGNVKGKFTGSGTHNVDNVKSGVKTLSKQGSGYPGNNKSAGPVGSGTGDKAGQTSVGKVVSPLNGAPNRNA